MDKVEDLQNCMSESKCYLSLGRHNSFAQELPCPSGIALKHSFEGFCTAMCEFRLESMPSPAKNKIMEGNFRSCVKVIRQHGYAHHMPVHVPPILVRRDLPGEASFFP